METQQIANGFFRELEGNVDFPHDIEISVQLVCPVSIAGIPKLTVELVNKWLDEHGISLPQTTKVGSRGIFGCIVAHRGKGIIFVNSSSNEAEQRFTIAHEIAHFLRDYQKPRELAIAKMGAGIRAVIDGERSPTEEEKVNAILSDVVIGTYSDLMLRGPKNEFVSLRTSSVEKQADDLAVELLAPYKKIKEYARPWLPSDYNNLYTKFENLLINEFGLPAVIAVNYASRLSSFLAQKPSIREWLGL